MLRSLSCVGCVCLIVACGGGGGGGGPAPAPLPPPPPPANTTDVAADLTSKEVVGGGAMTGSATAAFTIDLDDLTITGTVTVNGLTATAVTLNQGFAGETGAVLVTLNEDTATQWSIPANATLLQADLDALEAGAMYVQVTTAAEPDGAVRGQIIRGNIQLIFTLLSGNEHIPPLITMAVATAATTYDPDSGAVVVHVNTEGLDDAFAGHIHEALAGLSGGVRIGLVQDPDDITHWFTEDAMFDAALTDAFTSGALYLNIHTPANSGGEVRGQIEPGGVEIDFFTLTGAEVVPPVATANSGIAATTVQTASQVADVHVNLTGLDDATSVGIFQALAGQTGVELLTLGQDANDVAHWSLENLNLTDSQSVALSNQSLYLSVQTPAWMDGEVRSQLTPDSSTPGSGVAFSELQDQIFTPTCAVSGCHAGVGAPFGLDLSAGLAYGNLVNIDSGQNPSIKRVEPGDADNSYLVQKLEGNAGARMPLNQPALPMTQIQMVRDWINTGAIE
ncbi:MAG: CHRD domain-containing protein [Gammaproteobacteria bacterium]|nr:CHRD domain-containing protein [Gammaproteobacteria bacterium]